MAAAWFVFGVGVGACLLAATFIVWGYIAFTRRPFGPW